MPNSTPTIDANITSAPEHQPAGRVLFVDLDGTLIDGDLLRMALTAAIARPRLWPACLRGLSRGRAALKHVLSQHIQITPQSLSYRAEILDFVRRRKADGSRIVLATATAARWAAAVAEHLGCFDDVLSSTEAHNLKGTGKRDAIQAYCREHRFTGYGYVGDSLADLPIWQTADEAVVVAPSPSLLRRIRRLGRPYIILGAYSAASRPSVSPSQTS